MTEFKAVSKYGASHIPGNQDLSLMQEGKAFGNSSSLLAPGPKRVIVWQKQEATGEEV